MSNFRGNLAQSLLAAVTPKQWIIAVLIMLSAMVAILAISRFLRALTKNLRFQDYVVSLVSRLVGTLIFFVALVYALDELGVQIGPLLGALGIGGILIAMSLQPVLGNLVGSVMLHARRPIRRGDQIESNGTCGTVLDITGRAVVVMTFDGELVYLPNLKVLDEPLTNRTAEEFRRTLMAFQVGYEADLRTTKELLERAIREVEALDGAPPPDVLVTGFADSGVDMIARFWHPAEELTARWATSEVAITIRETLASNDIVIPFPQRVVHIADNKTSDTSQSTEDATSND